MLSVQITNKHNITQTFTEEFIDFTWSTRNNEGTDFTASVPRLNATVVLSIVNSFTKSITRGATAKVTASTADSLELCLSINEATNLERKGVCQISCTGNFFTATNKIFGSLNVSAADWSVTQARYNLQMVEMHEPNPYTLINVSKKEDIPLGVAWSFDKRRNISVTPFTTGDTNFSGDGIGIFRNAKEEENDAYTPVYRIEPEDIIDYDIEAAQPPVTHIQTMAPGKLAPTPQIPVATVRKFAGDSSTAFNVQVNSNIKAFYIEESQLSALWTFSEKSDGVAEDAVTAQLLTWSDGHVTYLGKAKRKIIGIFPDSFVEVVDGTTLQVVDRVSGLVITTLTGVTTTNLWIGDIGGSSADPQIQYELTNPRPVKTNMLIARGTTQTLLYVLWFRQVTAQGYYAVVYDGKNLPVLSNTQATYAGSHFGGSCKVHSSANSNIYAEGFYAMKTGTLTGTQVGFAVTATSGTTQYMTIAMPAMLSNLTVDNFTATDFIAARLQLSSTFPAYVIYRTNAVSGSAGFVYIMRINSNISQSTVTVTVDSGRQFVVDEEIISPVFTDTQQLQILQMDNSWGKFDVWYLINMTTAGATTTATGYYRDEWMRLFPYMVASGRNVHLTIARSAANTYLAYLQIIPVPYFTREIGEPTVPLKIADGSTNPVLLPFKVGALNQTDNFSWDKDLGRIEIDLAKFRVRDNSTGEYIEKDIQDLNVIAMSSYVKVRLDPDDTHYTLVKVTGFSLSYRGDVGAKLSGIITE